MIAELDIVFRCAKCDQKLVVESTGAGSEIDCPRCEHPVTIPQVRSLDDRRYGASSAAPPIDLRDSDAPPRVRSLNGDAPIPAKPHPADARRQAQLDLELAEVRADAHQTRDQMRALITERDRLSETLVKAQAEVQQAQAERALFKKEMAAASQRVSAAESRVATLEDDLAEALDHCSEETALREAVLGMRDQLTVEVGKLAAELSAARNLQDSTATEVAEAKARAYKLEALLATQERVLRQAVQNVDALSAGLAASEGRGAAAASLAAEGAAQMIEISARLDAALAEAASSRATLAEESLNLKAAEQSTAGAQQTLAELKNAGELEISAATARISALEARAMTAEEALATARIGAARLRADLAKSSDASAFTLLRDRAETADQAAEKARTDFQEGQTELLTLRSSVVRLETELATAQQRRDAAAQQLLALADDKMHRDNEVLRGILDRQKNELEHLHRGVSVHRRAQHGVRFAYAICAAMLLAVIAMAARYVPVAIDILRPETASAVMSR